MIITFFISVIFWIIFYKLLTSTKVSPGRYFYSENDSKYLSLNLWQLILIIISLFIPCLNVSVSAIALIVLIMYVGIEDNVKFVPKGTLEKVIKFLNKKI